MCILESIWLDEYKRSQFTVFPWIKTVRTVKVKWEYPQNTFVYWHICVPNTKRLIQKSHFDLMGTLIVHFLLTGGNLEFCLLFFISFFCVNIICSAPLSLQWAHNLSSQESAARIPSLISQAPVSQQDEIISFSGAEFITVWFSRHTDGSSHKLHIISNTLVTQCSCHIIF